MAPSAAIWVRSSAFPDTSARRQSWSPARRSPPRSSAGPRPSAHLEAIDEFVRAGFDRVYIHQVGPEQQAFLDFCAREILPDFAKAA